jgi:hypothetical protein
MEGVLVKRQGEAVSTTVAVDTASVTGCPLVVASVSMIDAFVSLICAGWLPQDGSVGW